MPTGFVPKHTSPGIFFNFPRKTATLVLSFCEAQYPGISKNWGVLRKKPLRMPFIAPAASSLHVLRPTGVALHNFEATSNWMKTYFIRRKFMNQGSHIFWKAQADGLHFFSHQTHQSSFWILALFKNVQGGRDQKGKSKRKDHNTTRSGDDETPRTSFKPAYQTYADEYGTHDVF